MADIDSLHDAKTIATLDSLLADLTAIATKLDADAGVTDTNYAATITTTS